MCFGWIWSQSGIGSRYLRLVPMALVKTVGRILSMPRFFGFEEYFRLKIGKGGGCFVIFS